MTTQFTPQDRTDLKEVLSRSRRTETRITRWLESQGIDTGIQRPFFKDGKVIVPSPAITLEIVIQTVPRSWSENTPIPVVLADTDDVLCRIIVD